ncbi:MAG: OmpA family protein [Gemmatimonadota bacterium]|nr:MAG: OmpA family protein [Gemmatimonadota bacterium]
MTMPRFSLLILAVALGPQPAVAQQGGNVELGAFGSYTMFDGSLAFDDRFGGGGYLGLFFLSRFSLEADISYTSTQTELLADATHAPIRGRLVYNQPLFRSLELLVGTGFVHNEYGGDVSGADNGFTWLGGLRIRISRPFALRLDGIADYMPSPANGSQLDWNYAFRGGFSVFLRPLFGGTEPTFVKSEAPPVAREAPDADRDGVSDQHDECPGTPEGESVDQRGCPAPRDTDGDGVIDGDDACPDTLAGLAVDARGCPVTRDSDGDGVSDAEDACPETQAGRAVDSSGCPLIGDKDGDGVLDSEDACPDTPAGGRIDARGCLPLFENDATRHLIEGVSFESGGAELTPDAREALDQVAASLVANPTLVVEIAGYGDGTGYDPYNLIISLGRACAVRHYLMSRGVPGERLFTQGYGSADPVASNATSEGRARNRRVELRLPSYYAQAWR